MRTLATLTLLLLGTFVGAQTGSMIYNSFQHNGVTREYKLYVPASYDGNSSVPLIFNLHGYTSNMDQQIAYGDFRSIADTANFLIVHPNGTFDGGGNRFWNAFGTPGVDDIGFLSTLIDTINDQYNVNLNRVYSTGMSNGGYMSFELACQLGNRITAVASVTGTMTNGRITACNAPKPTPIMQIHGTQDPTVPYNGDVNNESIPNVLDYWVNQTNCGTTPTVTNVPNSDPNDGCTAEHYFYDSGDQGTTVEHYKIIGGGHTWPGAPVDIGVTNHDIDASVEIWRFFSQYTMTQLAALDEETGVELNLFPNPSNGQIVVEFSDVKDAELKVLDALGSTVKEQKIKTGENTIVLAEKGIYFFQFRWNGSIETKRVVVR